LERNEQQHELIHLYGDGINLLGIQNAGKKSYNTTSSQQQHRRISITTVRDFLVPHKPYSHSCLQTSLSSLVQVTRYS